MRDLSNVSMESLLDVRAIHINFGVLYDALVVPSESPWLK